MKKKIMTQTETLEAGSALKKRASALVLSAVLVLLLVGCTSTKLADVFDEEQVKTTARTVVDDLIAGDYEAVTATMSQVMQEAVPAQSLADNMEMMNEQTGAFKEYKNTAVVGQKTAQGEDTAVAVIVASFEKRNVTYTVIFNVDMELDGLWMK